MFARNPTKTRGVVKPVQTLHTPTKTREVVKNPTNPYKTLQKPGMPSNPLQKPVQKPGKRSNPLQKPVNARQRPPTLCANPDVGQTPITNPTGGRSQSQESNLRSGAAEPAHNLLKPIRAVIPIPTHQSESVGQRKWLGPVPGRPGLSRHPPEPVRTKANLANRRTFRDTSAVVTSDPI